MNRAVLGTIVFLSATVGARADLSYTTTAKTTGGSMAAMAGNMNTSGKVYLKGSKMRNDTGDTSTIIDFDAQTITTLNHRTKTATVTKISDVASKNADMNMKIDVKETGQTKTVNGYNAKELLLTIDMEMPQMQQAGMGKMQLEIQLWLSSDVPGIAEMRDFYKKNMDHFPWAAMAGGNPQMSQAVAQLQKKMVELNGVAVEDVIKVKPAGGAGAPAMPQMTAAQQAQMQQAMEQMKQLQAQGGPAAAAAAQAMARMGNMGRGAAPGASNSLMEVTQDSTGFSSAAIPESQFAIPAGYTKN
jgi:hypothetical protein